MRSAWFLLCLAGTTASILPTQVFASAKSSPLNTRHRFDIAPQPLSDALRALSTQSGVRILFPYDEVASFRGRAVRGWLSTDQALDQLLAGTDLKRRNAGNGVIALAPANNRINAQRARLSVKFAQAATTADTGTMAMAAAPVDDDAEPAGAIIVTGTRQTNRTVADSLAPIDVLSKTDLEASGKQSVRDLLGTLVPSISVSNSGAGASFAVKTLSLRGLAGDQLLVLVNGKRRHNTATLFINGTTQNGQSPPDLDLIPSGAIERIEVLRDGASAQYGSDAIAGVVNIITKTDNAGSASMIGGVTGRGDGVTGRIQADYGFEVGPGGHFHFAIDSYMQERTLRGVANPTQFFDRINGQPDPREATVDRMVNKPGQPQVVGVNASYDAALPVGDSLELYSFGTFSKRHADAWLTFRTPNASNNVLEVYSLGYSPHLHIRDKDYQFVGGLRGDLAQDFHFDLSSSYAKNIVDYDTTGLNASLGPASPTNFYIGSVKASEWTTNLDLQYKVDLGLAEPLFIAAGAEYRENTYSIGAGELASYVDGGYRSPTGPLAGIIRQAGSQGVTGFPPSAAGEFSRESYSLYLNLEQKVIEGVDVALAGRHEDYSDFGTTDTGKASLRIEPVKGIAFRGTASTGFRAPTLQQIHYASSSTIGVLFPGETVTRLAPVRALPVDDPVAIALGAQPLKPEKSTNYSAGLVFTPTNRFNITVDAYQIEIKDRILLGGTLSGLADRNGANGLNAVGNILRSAGLNPIQSGFYFSNAASTRTRGLDIVGTYRANLGRLGSANFSLSANFNKTKFTRLDIPAVLAAKGLSLIDRARQGDFTKGTPRNKFVGNIFWTIDDFTLNLRATRYGEVTQVSTLAANDDVIDPKVLFDIEAGYTVHEGIKLSIGANNLFDIYPNILKPANQGAARFAYYNTYSPYGISGGYYYGKVSFTF